jgi:hypothetical protein
LQRHEVFQQAPFQDCKNQVVRLGN